MKKTMDLEVLREVLKDIEYGDWQKVTDTQLRMLHKRYSTIAELTLGIPLYELVRRDALERAQRTREIMEARKIWKDQ